MHWLVMACLLLQGMLTNVHAAQPVLVIWHVYSVDFFTEVSQQFERQTGVKIVAKAVISDDMQRNAFLAQQVGFSPDLLIMPSDQLMYAQVQGFTPFPDASLDAVDRETVAPNNLGIYLNAGSPILLYYNKRLVSEVATSFEQIINDTEGGVRPVA